MASAKRLVVLPHQGLGDLILCNGLLHHLGNSHSHVILLIRHTYEKEMRMAFQDSNNFSILPLLNFPGKIWARRSELIFGYLIGSLLRVFGWKFLPLGYLGKRFFGTNKKRLRFDESFYDQANVPFDARWSLFGVKRDLAEEEKLFKKLNPDGKDFAFLHEDPSRSFVIDRNYISPGLTIITPYDFGTQFPIWHYRKILENAKEIHVIESSFCAFIESIDVAGRKFAHRYARPEASGDWKHEFSYRTKWEVLLERK